ncbi:carbohydrate sulfotransferase 15-like [Lytechinus variegatus]|uniref:carbohydrate sulfotransferase 15-like n=1 Tax=Lytechinus variegatus TaxID=7654 RepID=UPI001BB29923|nr:carbohydrate sulfotransferase 15-like [Lytechinus variegatus]
MRKVTYTMIAFLLACAVAINIYILASERHQARLERAKNIRHTRKEYNKTEVGKQEPLGLGSNAVVRNSDVSNRKTSLLDSINPDIIRMAPEVFKTVPRRFLPDFKNPCWHDEHNELFCLPYFYVIGLHKCGTTDLWSKLIQHPDVVDTVLKEPHWWGKRRHGSMDYTLIPPHKKEARMVRRMLTYGKDDSSFDWYLTWFKMLGVDSVESNPSRNVFGDASISTAFSVGKSWGSEHRNYTNADLIHAIQPRAKIILLTRNPTKRFFSEYFYKSANKHKTLADLHKQAKFEVTCFTACLRRYSERHCTFKRPCGTSMSTIHLAIAEEWMRVFGREGVYVLRLEDWHKDMAGEFKRVLRFLELPALTEEEISQITRQKAANVNVRTAHLTMWNKTRDILQNFFKPFNRRMAKFMDDDRFLQYNEL